MLLLKLFTKFAEIRESKRKEHYSNKNWQSASDNVLIKVFCVHGTSPELHIKNKFGRIAFSLKGHVRV